MTNNTLQIGHLSFNSRLIQGPLAGYSCSPMRRLPWRYGGLAYTTTEMLSAHQMAHKQDKSPRYTHVANNEGPVCFQLSGDKPELLARAATYAEEYGAQLIDLNAGCPQPKIRKKNHGSALLAEGKQLAELIKAVKQHCECPVTLKIRIDAQSKEGFNQSVLEAAHAGGADALIVHGRHWKERYDTQACHDSIAWFVEQSDIPVIGNGDLNTPDSIDTFFKHTQAAGAMISRASLGQPWLFAQYEAFLRGETLTISDDDRWTCFIEHIRELIALENNEHLAILQARGFLKYYYPDLSKELRQEFFKHNTLVGIEKLKL